MIDLCRRNGRLFVVGHRGAAALAPENTLEGFRVAVELGVDAVELDVLALEHGPLVVAHSDRLEDVTHGAARGRVALRTLEELRELAPALPTFDEALAWFAAEAPEVGIHVDVKLRARVDEVAKLLEKHDVAGRAMVSSAYPAALRAVARVSPRVLLGLSYPEDRLNVSRHSALQPVVRLGLASMRASLAPRLPALVTRAGAGALLLQHRVVTEAAVRRAHAVAVPVVAWTVDRPADVERVRAAGVDGVITNDPRIALATLAP